MKPNFQTTTGANMYKPMPSILGKNVPAMKPFAQPNKIGQAQALQRFQKSQQSISSAKTAINTAGSKGIPAISPKFR